MALSGFEIFFFFYLNYSYSFLGWKWLGRRNHYIIISRSRSKLEKTMKKSVFSTFVCDPEIMLE